MQITALTFALCASFAAIATAARIPQRQGTSRVIYTDLPLRDMSASELYAGLKRKGQL
jgi:hypothetical protein